MPNSVKILKELLANKQKLDDVSHVELNAVCSAILQNKLPNKLKDQRCFTIPCLIGSLNVNNALADLGASINVMPYKMFKQLGLGKPKQTRCTRRPLLATARTIIDVGTDELILRVGDDTIKLQARDSVRISSNRDDIASSFDESNLVAQPSL
ncbi:reverse transcriptase [Gossypium australe]|uniref:Reverse transcriptase n=1 Tax=Gossypium australe TaxID=47621 RepID=A0A5B6WQW5_9ROSI|nr:reverse transcriptase [Gossypium australe]